MLEQVTTAPEAGWYCVRCQPKHEHIAAAHLSTMESVRVFYPRIRFRKLTRQGPAWVTESLFPAYLFAHFDLRNSLSRVHYAPGVSRIVHFGALWPKVPDLAIEELQNVLGEKEVHLVPETPEAGEEVLIAEGAFHGLRAVILKVMPARQRVQVLLDFLGRQTAVELDVHSVIRRPQGPARE
jgi:transcriptional antiterminator RfaH